MTEQDLGSGGVWTGSEWLWLAWESFTYDRTQDRWQELNTGDCPIESGTAFWTGQVVIGSSSWYDPAAGECVDIPVPPPGVRANDNPAMAWTGAQLLIWGGTSGIGDRSTTEGAAFSPVGL
jgi:hypothetical protein